MKNLKYLCESNDFIYYSNDYDEIIMQRKNDKKLFLVPEVNEGELYSDIENNEIVKIAPDFIYNFQELQKEIALNDKIEFENHYF
jgi:hypothetical protein